MANKFIVFSTLGQAKNYIKRKLHSHSYDDGCGCCYSYSYPVIQGKKILYIEHGSFGGNLTTTVTVIGRYKR
jgi:hypothetical protein